MSGDRLMSRKRGRVKGRKKQIRVSRVLFIGVILFVILGLLGNLSLIRHLKEFRTAIDRYDTRSLAKELLWINQNASWLKKIPMVRDGELWLNLNQGQFENLDSQLAEFSDDKHRFWLFQVHLAVGQDSEAQQDIEGLQSMSLRALAKGLMEARLGNFKEGVEQVHLSIDSDLGRDEQVLKNITLARLEMSLGNLDKAQEAWEVAEALSPMNPLISETEYDLALASGQWGRAKTIVAKLEEVPGYDQSPDFLIKRALLALTLGERQIWEQTIEKLSNIKNGNIYTDYLLGIEYYELGQFKQAAQSLESSMAGELPAAIYQDAKKAWEQATERIKAEPLLNNARKRS